MKRAICGILVLLSMLLLSPTTWAIEVRPDTLVEETAREVLKIIKRDKDTLSGNKEKILSLVKSKILPHFNFTRMTRLAMGKNWSKASPQQQQELEEAFRTLLVRTYYKALAVYSDHTIKVLPVKNMAGETDTTVKTEVIPSNGQAISINYRGTFNSKIRSSGVKGLLKALNKKNRAMEAKDKEKEKNTSLTIQIKTT